MINVKTIPELEEREPQVQPAESLEPTDENWEEYLNELLYAKNTPETVDLASKGTYKENIPEFVLINKVGIVKDYRAVLPFDHRLEKDPLVIMTKMAQKAEELIESNIEDHGEKVSIVLQANLKKNQYKVGQVFDENATPSETTKTVYLRNKTQPVLRKSDIKGIL